MGEIAAGGAFVELGTHDAGLGSGLKRAQAMVERYASRVASISSDAANTMSSIVSRFGAVGRGISAAFNVAATAANIYLAPVRLVAGAMWTATSAAISLGSAIAKIAWRNFQRGLLAVIGILGISLKSFSDLEHQLAMVSTMLSDPGRHLPGYKRGIRALSIEFGESTEVMAKGLYDILSASVPAEKALGVLRVATMAARAGFTDTGTAADALTTVMNSFGLSAENAADVSDLLFSIVARGKTTFGELAPVIGRVASIASSAGVSLEEMGAMLATMTRNGIRTEHAINALTAIISGFLKPSDEAAKLARTLGFEMSSTTLKAEGLRGVFERIKSLPPDVLARLFPDIQAVRGLMPALNDLAGFTDDLKAMEGRAFATRDAFESMANTTGMKFNQMRQSVVGMLTAIGEAFAPAFQRILETISSWAQDATAWFENHRAQVERIVDLLWFDIENIISDAWTWINSNVLEPLASRHDEIWTGIETGAKALWDTLQTIWAAGSSALSTAVDIVKLFIDDPAAAGARLAEAFNTAWGIASGAIDWEAGGEALNSLGKFFMGFVDKLAELGFVQKLMDLIGEVFAVNNALWSKVLEWTLSLGRAVADAVLNGLKSVITLENVLRMLSPGGAYGYDTVFGGKGKSLARGIPQFATGGVVDRPTLAMVGESGPEAIIPLRRGISAGAGVQQNININVRNPLDPEIGLGISRNLRRLENRGRR